MKIYKYRNLTKHLFDELKDSYLLMTSPFLLNDIYDCQLPDNVTKPANFLDKVLDELHNNEFVDQLKTDLKLHAEEIQLEYFNTVIKSLVEKHRLTCFTDDYNNLPMWAHYAYNHNGVCLEFDVELNANKIWDLLTYVEYIDELPTLYFPESFESKDEIEKIINTLLFTKQKKWEYECESRIMLLDNQVEPTIDPMRGKVKYDEKCLTALYFGYNIDESNFFLQVS